MPLVPEGVVIHEASTVSPDFVLQISCHGIVYLILRKTLLATALALCDVLAIPIGIL
jgi:hypothetical protein